MAASCSAEDEDGCVVSQCKWVGDTDSAGVNADAATGVADGRDAEVADGRHGEARVPDACEDDAAAAAAATSK